MIDYNVQITYPLTVTWSNTDGVFIRCLECAWCTPVILDGSTAYTDHAVEQGISHCTNDHIDGSGMKIEVFPVP